VNTHMSVTVNAPNALSATLPRTCDADAVRRHFGVYPQGNLFDSTNAIVPNLNTGTPPYRFDINPALLPTAQPPAPTAVATQGYSDLLLKLATPNAPILLLAAWVTSLILFCIRGRISGEKMLNLTQTDWSQPQYSFFLYTPDTLFAFIPTTLIVVCFALWKNNRRFLPC